MGTTEQLPLGREESTPSWAMGLALVATSILSLPSLEGARLRRSTAERWVAVLGPSYLVLNRLWGIEPKVEVGLGRAICIGSLRRLGGETVAAGRLRGKRKLDGLIVVLDRAAGRLGPISVAVYRTTGIRGGTVVVFGGTIIVFAPIGAIIVAVTITIIGTVATPITVAVSVAVAVPVSVVVSIAVSIATTGGAGISTGALSSEPILRGHFWVVDQHAIGLAWRC